MTAPVLVLIPGSRPDVGATVRIGRYGPKGAAGLLGTIVAIHTERPVPEFPVVVRVQGRNVQGRSFSIDWFLAFDEVEVVR